MPVPSSPSTPSWTSPTQTTAPSINSIDARGLLLPLTAAQESQVRDLYYKNVRAYCCDEIREFAHCAAGRTFTIPIACRTQRLAMNTCMNAHATQEEQDRAREMWFQQIPDRQRDREEKQRKHEEEKKKHREWWGLDEDGRRKALAEREAQKRF